METDAPNPQGVRVKVVGLLIRDGRSLWIEAFDRVTGERYLLPPGGGVEFGERLEEAVKRELLEEIRVDVSEVEMLGFSENFLRFNRWDEHELVFVFAAQCPEGWPADFDPIEIADSGRRQRGHWMTLDELRSAEARLYPDGILQMLSAQMRE